MPLWNVQPLADSDPIFGLVIFLILGIIGAFGQYQKWRQQRQAQQIRQAPPPPPVPTQHYPPARAPGGRPTPSTSPQSVRHPVGRRALPHVRPTPTHKSTVIVHKNTTIVHKAPRPTRVVTQVPAIPKPQLSGPRHAPVAAQPVEDAAYAHSRASEALSAQMKRGISSTPAVATPPAVTLPEAKRMLRPNNLRKQFILTELLGTPVALRDTTL